MAASLIASASRTASIRVGAVTVIVISCESGTAAICGARAQVAGVVSVG